MRRNFALVELPRSNHLSVFGWWFSCAIGCKQHSELKSLLWKSCLGQLAQVLSEIQKVTHCGESRRGAPKKEQLSAIRQTFEFALSKVLCLFSSTLLELIVIRKDEPWSSCYSNLLLWFSNPVTTNPPYTSHYCAVQFAGIDENLTFFKILA